MNGKLVQLADASFAQAHKEKDLEEWVEHNPSLLGRELTIIGRQVFIPKVGPLDLLAHDENGRLVVIEFKRHQTTRDTIAQILDYASSLRLVDREQLRNLPNVSAIGLAEVTDFDPAMIIVAAEADEPVERIVDYLTSRAQLPIEVVTFTYSTLDDGREIIARQILIPETPANESTGTARISRAELFSIARGREVLTLVEALHKVTALGWPDQRFRNNGGTTRYWVTSPEGNGRVLFGINIGGERLSSPPGTLDVWLNLDVVAKYSETSVESVLELLSSFRVLNQSNKRIDIRISDQGGANALYALLQKWDSTSAEFRAKQEAEQQSVL